MWVVINKNTKNVEIEVSTYKQGINYIKDKKSRGDKNQYIIKVK